MHGRAHSGTPAAEPLARTVAWFHRDPNTGEVLGPSVIETLQTLWRCGELSADSLVRPEGSSRFVKVRDAPALQLMLQGQAGQSQPSSPFRGAADYGADRAGRAPAHVAERCADVGTVTLRRWRDADAPRCTERSSKLSAQSWCAQERCSRRTWPSLPAGVRTLSRSSTPNARFCRHNEYGRISYD